MNEIVKQIREDDDKTIFICSSPYNVLIAVALILRAELYGRACIVMPSYSKKNIEYFKALCDRLSMINIPSVVIDKHSILFRAIGFSSIQNKIIMNDILRELHTERNAFLLVNHTWDRDKVCYPASLYFKYCRKAIFIEEGATQSTTPKENKWIIRLKKIYGNQTEYWKDTRIKGIFVQNPLLFTEYSIPDLMSFSLKADLSDEEKRIILDVFIDNDEKKEIEYMMENHRGIVFTQPISEDGYISEKEKIQIFTELTEYYSQYGEITLKIHPRDTTVYDIHGVNIARGSYPSELLMLLGIHFDFAIGLCTSAVETVDADIKINLNNNYLNELKYELCSLKFYKE